MSLDIKAPAYWLKTKLSIVASINMGQSPSSSDVNIDGKGLVFFQGKAEFGKSFPVARKYCSSPKKIANKGDILLSIRAPVGPTNLANQVSAIGRGLAAIKGNETFLHSPFLFYYFRAIESWMSQQGTGTTFKAISSQFLNELPFWLPPLAEQKSIADLLDQLTTQVDKLKTHLESIQTQLKQFRQSVLNAAVTGKLTKDWKVCNRPDGFYESCLQELGVLWGGKTPSKSKSEYWVHGIIPWVSPKDMKSDEIYNSEDSISELAVKETAMKILPLNTILMVTRSGIISHSFPIAITKKQVTINQDIKAFIPDQEKILANFAFILLKANEFYILNKCSKTGTTVPSIETKLLEKFKLIIPFSLKEQQEIVNRVQALFFFADKIEQQVKAAQDRVDNLTQSILAKAFRGELTTEWRKQHPELILGENSAKALMEKIQAEKAASQLAGKAASKKTKA